MFIIDSNNTVASWDADVINGGGSAVKITFGTRNVIEATTEDTEAAASVHFDPETYDGAGLTYELDGAPDPWTLQTDDAYEDSGMIIVRGIAGAEGEAYIIAKVDGEEAGRATVTVTTAK